EARVDNASGFLEAASSVVAREAQALWTPGDNTVQTAVNSILTAAKRGRIPFFSIVPADPKRGTLFDLGADFQEAGRLTGKLAVGIIRGSDPAAITGRGFAPRRLGGHKLGLNGLKEPWPVSEEVLQRAGGIVGEEGVHLNGAARQAHSDTPRPLAKKWKISIVEYNNIPDVEEAEQGILTGLRDSGLREGRDYHVTIRNAQGDMATVSTLVDSAVTEG